MSDRLTPSQRHRCMSHIRSKDTKPELKVRQWLWKHGYRYRLNVKGVPGKPDIVMRKYRTAIFINGCFWHGHKVKLDDENDVLNIANSKCCHIPHTNRKFWVDKISRNQQRDQLNYQLLQEGGWQVLVIWECQLTTRLLQQTMLQVELFLQEYYIRTLNRKSISYININDSDIPLAAEEDIDYNM